MEEDPLEYHTRKYKILIVEDSPFMRELLKKSMPLWEIFESADGEDGLKKARLYTPDLVILDLGLPKLDGYEVCQRLKDDPITFNIPVIILTASNDPATELKAIECGADDFQPKPFKGPNLRARIKMVLSRLERARNCNPLTGFPGNIIIDEEITKRLRSQDPLAVCYADLSYFKSFNDYYGYAKGDIVIKLTARILADAVKLHGGRKDFVGHIGGDDFIVLTDCHRHDKLCASAIENFDNLVVYQYHEEDRDRGFIETIDRRGNRQKFPVMTIAIGVVTNRVRPLSGPAQIADIAAELKCYIKKNFTRSKMFEDRRTE